MKTRLIVDSREQAPLEFKDGLFDEVIVEGLPVGDYLLEFFDEGGCYQVPLVFERKGLGDLFGTMTTGYKRFKREMQRAVENGIHLVLLIEGSMRDVHEGFKFSQFDGNAMLKKLAMLRVRHDLEYHFCMDRREMARLIEDWFMAVYRNYKKTKEIPATFKAKDPGFPLNTRF